MYRFRDTLPIDISEQTISGDLVTIENPEEMGVVDSLEVSLSPIQAGSGDPSPTNVRPISGRTSVETTRTGKNLLPYPYAQGVVTDHGITFTPNSDGTITMNGTATASAYYRISDDRHGTHNLFKLPNGNYKLTDGLSAPSNRYNIFMTAVKGTTVVQSDIALSNSRQNFSISDSLDYTHFRIGIVVQSGQVMDNVVFKPMIRLASDSDDTYEPYQGNTYTTALGRTVYGGTLDVVSGVLTVDRALLSAKWSAFTAKTTLGEYIRGRYDFSNIAWTKNMQAISNVSPVRTSGWNTDTLQLYLDTSITASTRVWAYLPVNTDGDTDVQVCIYLATPQTYQLTPQQIDLLLGTNHLWSDGEISVVWHKDLTKGRILPTEAVSINGQYIENVLDGYRTLYTKGRESLGAELNTYSVGTADGEKFKNKRYPARTITVGFQLIADNAEDFREKFNNLNNLLAIEEADFIFHDEEDKFFSGYPIMNAEVEAGQDSVKGEWHIYCAYPFKRSVEPIKLTMADATVTNTTATFTIDYKGSRPARPVLRATFAGAKSGGTSSEDGDCGFVAFMDGEENIIQLGNPDVLDLDEYTSAETLINKEFVNVSDWTRTGGHTYKGTVTGSVATSNAVDAFWDGGKGQTQSYAKPSYGSGTGLHGSILWKNTAGAVNFTLNAVHRLCVNNSNETGVFELGAYNHSTGRMVAGFVIDKSANGTTGVVRYIVNGKQVGTDQIDLSYYNNHFGYCNRTPVYVQQTYYDPVKQTYKVQVKTKKKKKKKKYVTKSRIVWVARTRTVFSRWNYTQSNLNSSIEKEGSYVYIQVGNLPLRTFNVPDVEQMIAHDASVFMGTYGTAMHTNMIHSLLFRREAGVPFAEQPNVFTAGDIVEADCNEATVNIYRDGSIGGHLEPQYGALGNDWEDFMLTSGTNVIRATWSEWVNPTYKPQIEIEYNEVFI
jgi:predicted phage tail component-like protein